MGQAIQRKRRALAVLKKAPANSRPSAAALRLLSFRAPTAAESKRGKVHGARAAELLRAPKVAAAH